MHANISTSSTAPTVSNQRIPVSIMPSACSLVRLLNSENVRNSPRYASWICCVG